MKYLQMSPGSVLFLPHIGKMKHTHTHLTALWQASVPS